MVWGEGGCCVGCLRAYASITLWVVQSTVSTTGDASTQLKDLREVRVRVLVTVRP